MVSFGEIESILAGGSGSINLSETVTGLLLAALLAYIMGKVYVRYGKTLSNRQKLADTFILTTAVTTLIIAVVKSSLALSLGLVGALSIIRFRAAIKEPEELAFLFFSISIGLGLGAGQFLLSSLSFAMITLFIIMRAGGPKKFQQNLGITVTGSISAEEVREILASHCKSVRLRRFDSSGNTSEMAFIITIKSFLTLEGIKKALEAKCKGVRMSYIELD